MEREEKLILELMQASMSSDSVSRISVSPNIYDELKRQAVHIMPACIFGHLDMPDNLRLKWKQDIYKQVLYFERYKACERQVLECIGYPVVVLKGSSVAKYYPHPEYRVMGDIDLLVKPVDYLLACDNLQKNGWIDITNAETDKRGRHRIFSKDGFTVELHHFFSSRVNENKGQLLDDILFQDIEKGRTELRDIPNGLVLLSHIAQHIYEGIGFKQIIDWMMFVKNILDDATWNNEFSILAKKIGMSTLAKTVTMMCQMYLGLSSGESWFSDADPKLCTELLNYVMESGNLGIAYKKHSAAFTSETLCLLRSTRKNTEIERNDDNKCLKASVIMGHLSKWLEYLWGFSRSIFEWILRKAKKVKRVIMIRKLGLVIKK